jgi:hypothetical protein
MMDFWASGTRLLLSKSNSPFFCFGAVLSFMVPFQIRNSDTKNRYSMYGTVQFLFPAHGLWTVVVPMVNYYLKFSFTYENFGNW